MVNQVTLTMIVEKPATKFSKKKKPKKSTDSYYKKTKTVFIIIFIICTLEMLELTDQEYYSYKQSELISGL